MRRFYFLILLVLWTVRPLEAGIFIYPDIDIPTLENCQSTLLKLGFAPKPKLLSRALDVFATAESMLGAAEKTNKEFVPIHATSGRRWLFRRRDDEANAKTILKDFNAKYSFIEYDQVFFLEGQDEFESLRTIKTQLPYLFGPEKLLLLGGLALGGVTPFVPLDVAPLTGTLSGIGAVSAFLFRVTAIMGISHQKRYDFVEYLVDCANKFDKATAKPVTFSISTSGGKTLNAAMIPGDQPQLAIVVRSLKK